MCPIADSVNAREMEAAVVPTAQLVVVSRRCRQTFARVTSARKRCTMAVVNSLAFSWYPR